MEKNFMKVGWLSQGVLCSISISISISKNIEKNFMKADWLSQGVLCSSSQVQSDKRDKCRLSPLQHI